MIMTMILFHTAFSLSTDATKKLKQLTRITWYSTVYWEWEGDKILFTK